MLYKEKPQALGKGVNCDLRLGIVSAWTDIQEKS